MKLRPRAPRSASRGFTLIEILVVVVIVAILAAVAYPSFTNSVRASRRADAVDALARVQQAQERWRANNPSYATNAQLTSNWPAGLQQQGTSQSGYYTITISNATATGYTVNATAVAGKSQASDKAGSVSCSPLQVIVAGNAVTYAPALCWKR